MKLSLNMERQHTAGEGMKSLTIRAQLSCNHSFWQETIGTFEEIHVQSYPNDDAAGPSLEQNGAAASTKQTGVD